MKEARVEPAKEGLVTKLEAKVANVAIGAASDRVENRDAVVAVVPITGTLTDPDLQLWPAILSVVRNAFVTGISSGFTHTAPPVAEKKEGPVKQAANALAKDSFPKAQPDKGRSAQ